MKLPKQLTTVTPLSKILALILFILLPILGFWAGKEFKNIQSFDNQKVVTPSITPIPPINNSEEWKTYTHPTLGFEFIYPKEWGEVLEGNNHVSIINDRFEYIEILAGGSNFILENMLPCPNPIPNNAVNACILQEPVEITFAEYPATQFRVGNGPIVEYLVTRVKSNPEIEINLTYYKGDTEEVQNKVLSSFKFLNNNSQLENLSWEKAVKLIEQCEVKMVSQRHSLNVQITLKNGKQYYTIEPQIDAVVDLAMQIEEKCGFRPIISIE